MGPRCQGGTRCWDAPHCRNHAPEATCGGSTASRRNRWGQRESIEAYVKNIIKLYGLDFWTNLQATSTAQCARNCTLPTTRVVSVRMLRCRSSFRFSSTSLEWRVNSFTYPTTGASTCASGALSVLYDSNLSIIRICAEKGKWKGVKLCYLLAWMDLFLKSSVW